MSSTTTSTLVILLEFYSSGWRELKHSVDADDSDAASETEYRYEGESDH